ncbi:GNAT family N-acetyltransferase [Paenibacillus sp. URB8-2]|uniref:GNAT family N-acetyltransferase n=1 Tax=Paenibacillus sp. URB8-2 TaxID=2741301 RepID=UPI0015B79254|nr:GNAT family protein [Paenibacillus sp. URB8-2]BCG60794.1 hypothetical protein PUR_42190 [Paenibacillus sp. URB8-2]
MKIELKPLNTSDFSVVVEWVNQHDQDFLMQWAGPTYQFPLTVEQVEEHYSKGINSLESDVYLYMIKDLTNNEPIGSIQIGRFDINNKEAIIGRFLMKDDEGYRGQGIGRRALYQLVQMGFEIFQLNRIKLNVYDINKRAIECYEV